MPSTYCLCSSFPTDKNKLNPTLFLLVSSRHFLQLWGQAAAPTRTVGMLTHTVSPFAGIFQIWDSEQYNSHCLLLQQWHCSSVLFCLIWGSLTPMFCQLLTPPHSPPWNSLYAIGSYSPTTHTKSPKDDGSFNQRCALWTHSTLKIIWEGQPHISCGYRKGLRILLPKICLMGTSNPHTY